MTAARLTLFCLILAACTPVQKRADDAPPIPPIDYAALRERHNTRVADIQQMWARSVVEIKWKDRDGKGQFIQGDGPLIVRRPGDLAMSIGKLGETFYWLGADVDRFWLFELRPPEGQPRSVYLGHHDQLANGKPNPLPLPIHPRWLIRLLGAGLMPEQNPVPKVDIHDRAYEVTLHHGSDLSHLAEQIRFDPKTLRPIGMSFLDAQGKAQVTATLENYEPIKTDGKAPGAWPVVPTRIALNSPLNETQVVIFLEGMTDQKVTDLQFDYERLVRIFKPEMVRRLRD